MGAVMGWFEHPMLGHRVHQWLHAGRAGEQIPCNGHQGPVEPV